LVRDYPKPFAGKKASPHGAAVRDWARVSSKVANAMRESREERLRLLPLYTRVLTGIL
jgi:hypothetical protein